MAKLTNTQVKHLKSLAHSLKPVVMIGDKGLTESVIEELKIALGAHELIKVNIRAEDKQDKENIIDKILAKTQSNKVQTIGGKLVIFKASKEAKVALPK
jgi:RNA-binding protein